MYFIGFLLWLLSFPLLAMTQISTQIYDIDMAKDGQDVTLVLLNTGQVAKIPAGGSGILNRLVEAKSKEQHYNFTLDDDRFIVDVEMVSGPANLKMLSPMMAEPATYLPTTIASMDVAKQYFREARYNPKDSQCFNRAMVWTYEWWRNHSLRSNKLLVYFTRTYIRRYNFEWWFHIAPYVHVKDQGKVVERVMDVKYSRGPIEFRRWTNIFVNGDVECPVITKFSDYADFPYTGQCYIQRTNMYTYQPADLQMNEAWNYTKDKFLMTEVRQAYLEAYDEVISKKVGE
ncbi:MAG: hypothetical protein H0V66_14010 [Bdellovibrionales bacterium]|nr:hypothetical protein [Bdellovibrionales bacterium]